jgi:hypothetical protein
VQVLEAGAEPRVATAFTFPVGKVEKARLELDTRAEQRGTVAASEKVTLKLEVNYPAADRVELVVLAAATTSTEVPAIRSAIGMRFGQTVHASGEGELPEVQYPENADPTAVEYLRGAVAQLACCLRLRLPAESLGAGARWSLGDDARFTVVEAQPGRLVIERTAERPGGEMIGVPNLRETQTYRLELPSSGVARSVEATLLVEGEDGMTRTTRMRFEVQATR